MKVAVTKGTLRVPPTYFALTHAEQMGSLHQFEVFCLVSDIRASTSLPIHDYVPLPQLGFRRRELAMPGFIPRMVGGIKKFGPDVIHQHFGTWASAATYSARRLGVPLVTTLHGADVFAFGREPLTAMAKWHHHNIRAVNQQSSRLLAVSNFLANEAVSAGLNPQKLEVHYQGIDTDYFTPAEAGDHSEPGEGPVLLFVGALSENKGIRDLVTASSTIYGSTQHRLVVVGDGILREELRQIIADRPHIQLVGSQPKSIVRDWMRRAQVLIVPSRAYNGAREAAGLVALEAAASGTPVIAYDSGGLREMMIPGTTGLLVEEGHVNELTQTIKDVLALPSREYTAMSAAARHFAVEKRSLKGSCEELARHYDDVTGRTG